MRKIMSILLTALFCIYPLSLRSLSSQHYNIDKKSMPTKKSFESFDKILKDLFDAFDNEDNKLAQNFYNSTEHITIQKYFINRQKNIIYNPTSSIVTKNYNSDHDVCYFLIRKWKTVFNIILNDLKNHRWENIYPQIRELSSLTIHIVKCFLNSNMDITMLESIGSSSTLPTDRKHCIYEHLRKVIDDLKIALQSLIHRDIERAKIYIQTAIDTLSDIINC